MKILGVDYGTRRVGLAVSDESQTLARELAVLSPKNFFTRLPVLLAENEVKKIVVGLPLNMSGEDTDKTREAREFAERLKTAANLPVEFFDERLSSAMAGSIADAGQASGRGHAGAKNIDSLAAQIILQSYLNRSLNRDL